MLCGMVTMPAFAASSTQDGLKVTLTTDKETYSEGEPIVATLAVTNTNQVALSNISLENSIPEGYKLADGSQAVKKLTSLGAGETVTLTVSYVVDTAGSGNTQTGSIDNTAAGNSSGNNGSTVTGNGSNATTSDNSMSGQNVDQFRSGKEASVPRTGDDANITLWLVLLTLAGAGIITLLILNRKKDIKTLSFFLGVLIAGAIAVGGPVQVQAAGSDTTNSIRVSQSIVVGGKPVVLYATVTYGGNEGGSHTEPVLSDLSLGEDVSPDLDFEPVEATPTFDSEEREVANIAALNDGEVPYSACDENGVPNYIDGKFSDKVVNSADDAIDALNDIHHLMQFENAKQEFEEVYSESVDLGQTTKYYRLQQMYHNIPVYGYQLVVSTNAAGEISTLTGHYYPGINVDITPVLSAQQAKDKIAESGSDAESVSDGLYIYIDESATLCWKIRTFSKSYFVDATTGSVVATISEVYEESVTGEGTTLLNQEVSFPVSVSGETYSLYDNLRNICVADANHKDSTGTLVTANSNENWDTYPTAITVYTNMIKIFDYYANVLGRDGADDSHTKIYVDVNYRDPSSLDSNGQYSNAFYSSSVKGCTFIAIGDGNDYPKALDVLAHEFTHSVTNSIWAGVYQDESGALNEAYSDIIGDLFEDGSLYLHGEDLAMGANRNFADPSSPENPNATRQPSHYSDRYTGTGDNGGVHVNSGIINHAAYLMDQNWPTDNHADELLTLFYKSMYYLSPNSNFLDCRYALLAAAKSMNMSDEKRNVIATALADVGVVNQDDEAWASAHHIIGVVKDAETNSPVIDAEIIAVATKGLGGGIGYSDGNGNYDVKVNRAVYTVSVFADGYKSYTIKNVDLSAWFNLNHYMETIYLTPASWADDTQNVFASGKITNALTGEALEGVTVKFRNGSNNQSGAYVQTVAGMDIELTTDHSGQYYTAALPAGNYTLEASKDGFITGYVNIISGNSSVCSNQNLSITPELNADTIRIVLTWGANPRDLDSHVKGTLSGGNSFHVYFGHKSQYDGDVETCNLDVDDTTSYGPETITLNVTTSNPYYYYIYQYAGSGTLASSGAQVKVYQGENLIGTFNVPTDQGSSRYWNVFAVVDGNIVVNNTITAAPDVSYASVSGASIMTLDNFESAELEQESEAAKDYEADSEMLPADEEPTSETKTTEPAAVTENAGADTATETAEPEEKTEDAADLTETVEPDATAAGSVRTEEMEEPVETEN